MQTRNVKSQVHLPKSEFTYLGLVRIAERPSIKVIRLQRRIDQLRNEGR